MLSIIVLTHNSEEVIADCLESLRGLGDEIIVVDSESSDRTAQLAERLGAKVISHKFIDFADQRNFSISQTKGEWVLYLDSDEQATEEFKRNVKNVIEHFSENSGIGGYYIRRKTFYFGKDWGFVDRVQRLFYKPKFLSWYGKVHETPKAEGRFEVIEYPILHFTHRDLSQMVEKTNEWSEVEVDLRFRANHPQMNVVRFIRVMLTAFLRSYVFEKGYKNGTAGLVESMYQAFSMFITYAKLWEKQLLQSGKK